MNDFKSIVEHVMYATYRFWSEVAQHWQIIQFPRWVEVEVKVILKGWQLRVCCCLNLGSASLCEHHVSNICLFLLTYNQSVALFFKNLNILNSAWGEGQIKERKNYQYNKWKWWEMKCILEPNLLKTMQSNL